MPGRGSMARARSSKVDPRAEYKILGARLRESRVFLRLTKSEVANKVGMARTAIISVESGRRKVGALELRNLARLYGRSLSYFVDHRAVESPVSKDFDDVIRAASLLSSHQLAQLIQFAKFLHAGDHAQEA
jgi:transcriptional regulator with XRE-family HTH domain